MSRARTHGFTLIEVLVALTIVALAAAALTHALRSGIDTTAHLRDRLFAQWVAENRLTETRLAPQLAPLGSTSGEVEFGTQRWRWRQQISPTPFEGVRRIAIEVRRGADLESSAALATLEGFQGDALLDRGRTDAAWDAAQRGQN